MSSALASCQISHLQLLQFKHCEQGQWAFGPRFNLLHGANGVGKTTVLDALHYLCLSKSHFHPDKQSIMRGRDFFRIEGQFSKGSERFKIACAYPHQRKKLLTRDGQPYARYSEHIGLLPVVMLAPDDLSLITGGSEERRQFLDLLLSQSQASYLQALMRYNRILEQRNALLKGRIDWDLLDTYDQEMQAPALLIFKARQSVCAQLALRYAEYYAQLSGGQEKVSLSLRSDLQQQAWLELQAQARPRDVQLQRSTAGIHRDDLILSLHEDLTLKQYASQGQRKTAFLALKLAQYALLAEACNCKPLLLLDDVCDKLDEWRTQALLNLLAQASFGQVFFTDTQRARIADYCQDKGLELKIFELIQA